MMKKDEKFLNIFVAISLIFYIGFIVLLSIIFKDTSATIWDNYPILLGIILSIIFYNKPYKGIALTLFILNILILMMTLGSGMFLNPNEITLTNIPIGNIIFYLLILIEFILISASIAYFNQTKEQNLSKTIWSKILIWSILLTLALAVLSYL
jgi:hypothetical protein